MIYFDNAATTLPKPKEVGEAMVESLNSFGNPSRGGHSFSINSSRIVYETRELLGRLFNLKDPLNIAFTTNSTMALNLGILGIGLKKGDEIITSVMEHNSVLRPIYILEKMGINVKFLKVDKVGNIDYSAIEKNINKCTKAIILTHSSNLSGNLIDVKLIGNIAKRNNLLFILDASQSAGIFPIDVEKDNVDILCFTGHKGLLGPTGVGGIYVSPKIKISPFVVGGSGSHSFEKDHPKEMPDRLEAGTPNIHGIAGLNASLKYIFRIGIKNIRDIELKLAEKFYLGVKDNPKITIYGDFSTRYRSPIVSLNIQGISSTDLSDFLSEEHDIATRSGIHCAPLMHMGFQTEKTGIVRFSFSHFNTDKEIEKTIKILNDIANSIK